MADIIFGTYTKHKNGFSLTEILTVGAALETDPGKRASFIAHGYCKGKPNHVILDLKDAFTVSAHQIQEELLPFDSVTGFGYVVYDFWTQNSEYPKHNGQRHGKDFVYIMQKDHTSSDEFLKGTKGAKIHGHLFGFYADSPDNAVFVRTDEATKGPLQYITLYDKERGDIPVVCNNNALPYKAVLMLQILGGSDIQYKNEAELKQNNQFFHMIAEQGDENNA